MLPNDLHPARRRGQKIIAVYAGSFDPITHGHLDLIYRASGLFNEVLIGVGVNPDKAELFTQEERLNLIKPHVRKLRNVRLAAYTGLTIDFVCKHKAHVLIRGIRDVADLAHELVQANVNMAIGDVETVFLLTSDQYVMTSSTYIRQIYEMGGGDRQRVERLVPPNVARALERKLTRRHPNGRRRRTTS